MISTADPLVEVQIEVVTGNTEVVDATEIDSV